MDDSVMVYVPEGTFWMGSTDADVDDAFALCIKYYGPCKREWFERGIPQHQVYLDAFWIDQREVTNAQYKQCVGAGMCSPPAQAESATHSSYYGNPQFSNYPVIYVGWDQADAYCRWAGKRLPTEAQWEKAARGTDKRIYPWGNGFDGTRLNFCDVSCGFDWKDSAVNDGYADTAPVGSYPAGASPYNALDMSGNVWEWVADWFDASYYTGSPIENPLGPDSGNYHVLRGGSWHNSQDNAQCAFRNKIDTDSGWANIGFRCCVVAGQE
jgi:formylglycine-generating enzyme required for sulfatase activity